MRLGLRCLVAVVSVVLLSSFAVSVVSSSAGGSAAVSSGGTPVVPRSSGSSPKVHLIEGITGTWCQWCGVVDPALARFVEERTNNVIFVSYHGPVGSDPYADAGVINIRAPFYTVVGYPTTIMDGGGATLGNDNPLYMLGSQDPDGNNAPDAVDVPANYDWIASTFQTYTDTSSNIAISIAGDLGPTSATVSVSITATDAVPQTNLYVRTVLYEDSLYYTQSHGPPFHLNVGRALNEQPLTIAMGQTVTKTATFTLNPMWRMSNLGVVAFVQSNTKRSFSIAGYGSTFYASDVLNAAQYRFTKPGILVYPDTGTAADYTETYQALLAQAGLSFETWDTYTAGVDTGTTDVRDLPSAAALAESGALLWVTSGRSAPILTAADRTLIASYLSGSPGNLLMLGDGLGFDGWTNYKPWYQTYLHATFSGDNSGVFTVTGAAGDPIGDAFKTTTLNVLAGSSPDRVDGYGVGQGVPFTYTGGISASVRAQHDANSRVVYLGFQYFENTGDANRVPVMKAILNWLDGAAPPTVTVNSPAQCQVVAPGSTFPIRWTVTDVNVTSVDLSYSVNSGVSWMPIAAGEPNDGVYLWTVPSAPTSNARVQVTAHDSAMQTGTGMTPNDFMISTTTTGVTCNMAFTSADVGWHLISFPLIPTNPNAVSILSTLGGSYDVARAYVPTDTYAWKSYVPAKGSGDLTTLDQRMGFWVRITGPGTLSVTGDVPTTPQRITLQPGWNLVGFPSYNPTYTVADLKAATGATRVDGFSNVGPYYLQVLPDSATMTLGQGYWVYVPSLITWTVPL